jgi:hypothetical protein
VTARHLADGMAKTLNVPVPVVNRTGGGGAIGYSHVKQQKPDGHAIIWNSNSISSTYHSGILPFDYSVRRRGAGEHRDARSRCAPTRRGRRSTSARLR